MVISKILELAKGKDEVWLKTKVSPKHGTSKDFISGDKKSETP